MLSEVNELKIKQEQDIQKLISLHIRFTEATFDAMEKVMVRFETTRDGKKYVSSTKAKWELRKLRAEVLRKLRVACV